VNVHCINCDFRNAGDLLMALAVRQACGKKGRLDACFVNGYRISGPHDLMIRGEARQQNQLRQTADASRAYYPQAVERGDLVLDVNGYRHGGHWPRRNTLRDLDFARAVRAAGARYILLPKSYGPFDDASAALFRDLLLQADAAYARDRESMDFCRPLDDTGKVRFAPDFTAIYRARPTFVSLLAGSLTFVPNLKLVERGVFERIEDYIEYLDLARRYFESKGRRFVVLYHQHGDYATLAPLLEPRGILNVYCDDPGLIKCLIGLAAAVVSSRYHGMVNAVSQNVPCLVLGWSHKYSGFLDLYRLSDRLLIAGTEIRELIARYEAIEGDVQLSACMRAGNERVVRETEAMWEQILGVPEKRAPS
jgi:colanic acid/amylovoran biosynthesis protein